MRSMATAESKPPDGELGEIEQAVRTGERDAIVGTDRQGRQAAFLEELLEGGDGGVLAGRFQRLTKQKIARGVVGDGEGIAIAPVAELEFALEVGAPEIVGRSPICPVQTVTYVSGRSRDQ